jgi:ribosomal protein S18 acetylase RimI-like enzyme
VDSGHREAQRRRSGSEALVPGGRSADDLVIEIDVREATPADVPTMADILARALADSPFTVWHTPDAERRVGVMTRLLTAGLEHLWLRHGEVYTTSGEIAGCCIWMPPGAESNRDDGTASFDEALTRLFQDSPRLSELFAIFERNHPTQPRYYLPFIAVDPSTQRRGVGKAMVAPVLAKCDRDGIVAYLEADDRSRPFHERNGFKVIGEVRVPYGPSVWPMERSPQ